MGAIPTQRESMARAPDAPAHHRAGQGAVARTSLPGTPLAPGAARRFVRGALADWAELALPGAEIIDDRLIDDAVVVVSELVTNAVVHAGTDVDLLCRLEGASDEAPGPLVVEVSDHHPSRALRDDAVERPYGTPEYGRGLRLVASLSEAWGITYRPGIKTVWARLPVDGCAGADGMTEAGTGSVSEAGGFADTAEHMAKKEQIAAYATGQALERGLRAGEPLAPEILPPEPRRRVQQDQDWLNRGALSFLAEASDLLAGQLDEDLVAALAGQLLVPRLADWCAVWLEDEATDRAGGLGLALGPRLARVWHGSENLIEELRSALEKDPPRLPDAVRSRAVPVPWPGEALGARGVSGAALAYRLIAGGRPLGTLVIGRAGLIDFPDEITGLVEDLSRRIALAIGAARQYARQATISRVLQRGLLPGAVAEIPGVRSALVYEPLDKGGPSGDFYDVFPAGDGRWCFAVGDVQGKGPEAAVVIGLARPWLRLLAREGYQVADVLDRLNQLLLDDATEVADAAARALVAAGGPGLGADPGPQTRFLSMLYGELVPFDGGVRCTLASAGHPLPLLLGPDGDVREVARPQTLLGVFEDAGYTSETFELHPGDTVLCVTDGVTERRCGPRQFDDDDGLAKALEGCAGLSAELVAERIRRLVHEFGTRPPEDDMALLVLQAE
ncbi:MULTISPECIES: SpoIIE family protein phosphatase [unclassified Streptomyces]|uniref:SpoIIE family protein phosphatase n=1 Tax=unclassified Streptomyces TaxID=2593676 RepID=UPI002E80DD34|nr:SpoIIE family protein phosphatase [Streptomyces sp. NBC_00589]WTI39294.1 SpoIIE family protein phosphatase [Streptomyces sp. NBC_00775]WUB27027.1 SpoIIE family protein phosphatase [Streptomyces sp. NBC_00589]